MTGSRGVLVAAVAVLVLAGCGSESTADAPGTAMTTTAATATTDETACAGSGTAGVEERLDDVYDDEAASQALVEEHAGAPRFQEGLEQTLELLRSSDGELEGDFLAQACGG